MDLDIYIQLVFLYVVNVLFTFSGIVLNTLAIASFWKSFQLRKKVCHFMIMVLSCFDLVSVVICYPGILVSLTFWFKEDYDFLLKMMIYGDIAAIFLGFSVLILLVMSIERYLGAYYPIFHSTSVTRRRLLTLLGTLLVFHSTLGILAQNDWVISQSVHLIVFLGITSMLIFFINFKLYKISRQMRRRKAAVSPEQTQQRMRINLKNISTCLLAVACIGLLSIPTCVYIVFNINTKGKWDSNAALSYVWTATIYTMNCTFNSLIFFWKNKVLRIEGIKILITLEGRLFGSFWIKSIS